MIREQLLASATEQIQAGDLPNAEAILMQQWRVIGRVVKGSNKRKWKMYWVDTSIAGDAAKVEASKSIWKQDWAAAMSKGTAVKAVP